MDDKDELMKLEEETDDNFDEETDDNSAEDSDLEKELYEAEIDDSTTAISNSTKSNIIKGVVMVILLGLVSFWLFMPDKKVVKEEEENTRIKSPPLDNNAKLPFGEKIKKKPISEEKIRQREEAKLLKELALPNTIKSPNLNLPTDLEVNPDNNLTRKLSELLQEEKKEKEEYNKLLEKARNLNKSPTNDKKTDKGKNIQREEDRARNDINNETEAKKIERKAIDDLFEDKQGGFSSEGTNTTEGETKKGEDNLINWGGEEGEEEIKFTQQELERLSAPMSVMNSGINPRTSKGRASLEVSKATSVKATKIANPNVTIVQGKVIDTILETAIDTSLKGNITAIITRDVYAASSTQVLIPKGSRVIGTYGSDIVRGQRRVMITWNRVITTDNIDIEIESPGTDQFGRSGIAGDIDNRYFEIFNSVALYSLISLGTAAILQGIEGDNSNIVEDTRSDGSSTVKSSVVSDAGKQVIDKIASTAGGVTDKLSDSQPIVTIRQGTKIKILVNRDLIFTDKSEQNVRIIK